MGKGAGVEIINITALLLTMMIVVITMMKEDVGIVIKKNVIMAVIMIITIIIDVIGNVGALRKLDPLKGLHLDKRIRFGIIVGRQWNCKRKLTQWRNAVGIYWTTFAPEIPKI